MPTKNASRPSWLATLTQCRGLLDGGALWAFRLAQPEAMWLRHTIWERAANGLTPSAWLEVGPPTAPSRRTEVLMAVPRRAWPVLGQAYDWPSAWSWAERWHERLKDSWVVIEAEAPIAPAPGALVAPTALPPGLSVGRERRLRALLREQAGRLLALTT